MIIDKYNRINIDKLPADVAAEFKQIASDTDNFEDDELVEIYKDNFNDLFKIVEEKYPEALKPKTKLIKKSEKKKIVKKAEPKKKIKATKKDVDDLKQPDAKVFNVGDEVYAYNDDQLTTTWSKIKTKDQNKKYSGIITKKKKGVYPGQFNYYVKTKDSEIFLSGRYAQAELIGPTGKDIDLSMLVGKKVSIQEEGNPDSGEYTIKEASVTDPKFEKRDVIISVSKNTEEKFPLSKLEAFLEGKPVEAKYKDTAYIITLKNASEIDCETAIAEIKAIHAKRDAAAKKRADAPKKKVTTAAREKQIKTFTSVFKTKEFKADKKQAEGFAKDIVAVYNKYGLKSMAEQLEKDIQELIDSKYSKEKMAKGGQIDAKSSYQIIPMKKVQIIGRNDIVEPYYSLAFKFDGTLSQANEAAMNYVTTNDNIEAASVIKIHPSGQPLKNKKVSYVTKEGIQKMDKGGQIDEEYIDLFDDYEAIPAKVQKVLEKHSDAFENGSYEGLKNAKEDMEKIGYTFEYYLDGSAYDLRKIGQKGLSEKQ